VIKFINLPCRAVILALLLLPLIGRGAEPVTDLNLFLQKQLEAGTRTIVLPPGTIRIADTVKLDAAFHDLTITGNGKTTLVMTRLTEAFFLRGCRNVTLSGFTVDYDPLPFTQGTVEAVNGNAVTFSVHDGYPDLTAAYLVRHALFFAAADRNWRWESRPNHTVKVEAISPRRGVVTLAQPPEVKIGDYVVLNARATAAFVLRNQAENITFRDITILSAPGAGFIARRTSGQHRFERVVIKRGPTPSGATEARLLAAGADGINYGTSRQGPIITDCDLSFIGDDSVNFHGALLPVLKQEGRDFIVSLGYQPDDLGKVIQPGDMVRILNPGNYQVEKTARLEAIEPFKVITAAEMATYGGSNLYPNAPPNFILYRMRLQDAVPQAGQFIDVPAVNCPGFVIRDSYFHDHRARGLRIQANNGKIENCRFKNLEQSAIAVGPEYAYWLEAGWTNNIAISGNVIEDVCQGGISWSEHSYFGGAITIFSRRSQNTAPWWHGNTAITIKNNIITGCPVSGILILTGNNVTVSDNQISRVNRIDPAVIGKNHGLRYHPEPISVIESDNVNITPPTTDKK